MRWAYVLPALGHIALRDVRPQDVQDLVRSVIARGRKVQSALHVKNCVSAIFRHAKSCQAYSGDLPTECGCPSWNQDPAAQ